MDMDRMRISRVVHEITYLDGVDNGTLRDAVIPIGIVEQVSRRSAVTVAHFDKCQLPRLDGERWIDADNFGKLRRDLAVVFSFPTPGDAELHQLRGNHHPARRIRRAGVIVQNYLLSGVRGEI